MTAETYLRPADFDQHRFCPYHGDFILLADCPIVATNSSFSAREQVAAQQAAPAADPVANDVFGGASPDDAPSAFASTDGDPPITAADVARKGADECFQRNKRLTSSVDGQFRTVLHGPPARPAERRRRILGTRRARLPVPAELADDAGGARARPARACPRCLHPLPHAIDSRDPLLVPLVGHRGASKTTTVAAFVEALGAHGPNAFELDHVAPTEQTFLDLTEILRPFRERRDVDMTGAGWNRPFEFVAERGRRSSIVFLHDVPGEDVMQADKRMSVAPFVLWADAILFVYTPDASPLLRDSIGGRDGESSDVEQAAVLNGLLDDLQASPRLDPSGRTSHIPPLVIAVSKADLLPSPPDLSGEPPDEEAVKAAIAGLGDRATVAAGERWPQTYWHFVAPKPPSGEPQGVVPLFRRLLTLATR